MLRRRRSQLAVCAAVAALAAATVPVLDAVSADSAPNGGSQSQSTTQPGGYFDLVRGVDLVASPSAITQVDAYCRQSGQVFGLYDLRTRIPIVAGDFTGGGTATLRYPYGTQLVTVQIVGHVDATSVGGSLSTVSGSPTRCDAVQFSAPFLGAGARP